MERKRAFWASPSRKKEQVEAKEERYRTDRTQSTGKPKTIVVNPIVKKTLMTEREEDMYEQLVRALPYSAIFPQVSFNSLIQETEEIKDAWQKQGVRSQFNRMVVDFVVYDPKRHEVITIIELDDYTHDNDQQKERDEKRDTMLRQAGYHVLRYEDIPDLGNIIKKIKAIHELSR